ncbi:Bifunctional dehydrogenase and ferrochelatase [Malassezia caprae]|uniref:precorrin-2 dehydrogenase n=1 Tax=Malassezia caprae TaxID=1381934 RepID=A0AAF0E730_9BASI|nr:Bifunctional dehydrogenase and ferrochelatase [Malassezia caprae]
MTAPAVSGGLPIVWQLRDRCVLLVGGGEVAASRVVHLAAAGAHITVLAPASGLHPDVRAWIDDGTIGAHVDALYRDPTQLVRASGQDYDMILTAIDDAERSREVCEWSRARRIPVNVADVPDKCDFYFGSMIRRGPLQVMVSTNGRGPRLARIVRQQIEAAIPAAAGDAIMRVGLLRAKLRAHAPEAGLASERMAWMSRICDTLSMDALARLDDATAERWVREAWPTRTVPRMPWQWRVSTVVSWRDITSFLMGCTSMALVALWYRRQ